MTLGAHLDEVLSARLPKDILERLEKLDEIVARWGKVIDLTGFKSVAERHRRYFGEALSALPWLPERGRAVDIGSGGGSPALPLAIARPDVSWTLVEANERKGMFLDEAARTLRLDSAKIVCSRYQDFVPVGQADVVTLRGVAATAELFDKVALELGGAGRLLWFSSEARLSEAAGSGWVRVEGPIELVPGGGCLGIFEPIR